MTRATIKSTTTLAADVTGKLSRYVFEVERFEGGHREVVWDVMERGHSVGVLGHDPERDEVVLIREFRPGAAVAGDPAFFETLVAGTIEGDESPETVAIREMKEEAGLVLTEPVVIHAGAYVSAGSTSEKVAIVAGRVDTRLAGGIHGKAREDENIKTVVLPAAEFIHKVRSGALFDMKTLLAGYWLAENRR
jgi:ADP-ribose pyrophosphatase